MRPAAAQYLDELDEDYAEEMINVNCRATVRMCKAVLPGMVRRRKGAIVNIGSAAATVLPADPLYAVYAGTKGFVDQLSRTLTTEYAHKGIHVQLQAPLYVATKMSKIRRASLTVPSAKAARAPARRPRAARARGVAHPQSVHGSAPPQHVPSPWRARSTPRRALRSLATSRV